MSEDTETAFTDDHPAPALRFTEQLHRLRDDGWWPTVAEIPSDHVSLMERLSATEYQKHFFHHNDAAVPAFVSTFRRVIPSIHSLVTDITAHLSRASVDFRDRRDDIEECLLNGVVPSQLLTESNTSSPTPVSMINGAYCVYLYRLPELMDKLEHQHPRNLDQRATVIQKLEGWTLKAIEDYRLLVASASGGLDDN